MRPQKLYPNPFMRFHFLKNILLLLFLCLLLKPATGSAFRLFATAEEYAPEKIFPFNYNRIDVHYDLFLDLADTAVHNKYAPLFIQYKLAFSGEVWEVLLRQMLERIDHDMLAQVQLVPEDEGVYIHTANRTVQQKFLRELLPGLSNLLLLEKHLQRIDQAVLQE